MTVRISLVLVGIAAGACWWFEPDIGLGVAMGGMAGTAAFWMLARKVERFAGMTPDKVSSEAAKGMLLRMVVYGLALWRAWALDPETNLPLFAAVAGIFIPRAVIFFLAFTSLDLSQGKS